MKMTELSVYDKVVFVQIMKYVGANTGYTVPVSHLKLSERTGIGHTAINDRIKKLQSMELIAVFDKGYDKSTKKHRANVYMPNWNKLAEILKTKQADKEKQHTVSDEETHRFEWANTPFQMKEHTVSNEKTAVKRCVSQCSSQDITQVSSQDSLSAERERDASLEESPHEPNKVPLENI